MKKKISGVYKITNTITDDFYIGSSRNIEDRWTHHKCPSAWKKQQNNLLYLDFQKYGLENFKFEIIEETSQLREREQYFIDLLQPTYNDRRSNGLNIERRKKYQKEYRQTDESKEYQKEYHKEYRQTEKYKDIHRKSNKKYFNRLCLYNGETLTLSALSNRFYKQHITNPVLKAKDYLL